MTKDYRSKEEGDYDIARLRVSERSREVTANLLDFNRAYVLIEIQLQEATEDGYLSGIRSARDIAESSTSLEEVRTQL